ncbi:DUF2065 family protein [Xylophilus rhododendri]|uniref:DUF2065 family protein n=1 Tax=Xylophilus rhododendri TaxID=2697032 RepID=A0A857JAN2_9BURK|nr:DUF2065 domain-containing protein [Xylophilus rhododendri]QHJ00778.1 DUF2065 family protein [Xylophilus rhododendri]
MDWTVLLQALGLLLVLEGLGPFLSPGRWRAAMARLAQLGDQPLRLFALASMLCGLLLLWCAH